MSVRPRFDFEPLLALLLALVFLVVGLAKLVSADLVVATFGGWTDSLWTLRAVGLVELTAAGLLFVSFTRSIGASLAAAVMLGASLYQLLQGQTLAASLPIALLVLAFGLLYVRASRTLALPDDVLR